MKKLCLPLLLCLMILVAPTRPAISRELPRSLIEGGDDRILEEAQGHPWGAIGRLNSTLGPFCTGTLVGPRQVLTAAHCLWNKRTANWLPPCALHFLLGYQRSEFLEHSLVVAYRLEGKRLPEETPGPPEITHDWAVLTLAEDLSSIATPLVVGPLDSELLANYREAGGEFVQAGYSRDRAHILTLHDNCSLAGFTGKGRLVLHECDATFGDSGSPILLRLDGGYRVVAMHLAIADSEPTGIALAGSAFYGRLHYSDPSLPAEPFRGCHAQPDGTSDTDLASADFAGES